MEALTLLLATAALGHAAARGLGAPSVPLLLLGGFVLGSVGGADAALLEEVTVLGVTALLFIAGLELDPRRPQAQLRAALWVGVGQFVALAGLGVAAALALGWDPATAAYLGLALSVSSTLVVVRLLKRRQEMFEPFGRLTVGVLLVQDLLLILLLPFIDRALGGEGATWTGVLATLGMVALALAAARWTSPLLLRVERDGETLLMAVLLQLAAFLGLSALLGIPLVVGAFLAGVSLSRFPVSTGVRPLLGSLGDFFAALFFTALGALVGVPTPAELGQALALALLLVAATPVLVAAMGEAAGLPARPAVEAGLLLAQASELSLVVGLVGMERGVLAPSAFTVLALVTGVTMLLTPLLGTDAVTTWLLRWHPFADRYGATGELPDDPVLLLGAGATGMPLVEALGRAGHPVVVVDDDPAVLERASQMGAAVVRGDAADRRTLQRALRRPPKVVVSTLRRPSDNGRVLELAGSTPVLVRVFEDAEARRIMELGGIPVLTSDAAAESLLEWFETHLAR